MTTNRCSSVLRYTLLRLHAAVERLRLHACKFTQLESGDYALLKKGKPLSGNSYEAIDKVERANRSAESDEGIPCLCGLAEKAFQCNDATKRAFFRKAASLYGEQLEGASPGLHHS
jgi:hypothetical protein